MLIYCTSIWLKTETNIDQILRTAAEWLSRKAKEQVIVSELKTTSQRRFRDGSRLYMFASDSAYPVAYAVRLTHGDSDVSGRQWITEIGIRREHEDSETECSILLRTEEISSRVNTAVQPTAPYIVHSLIKSCVPSMRTCGTDIEVVDDDDAAIALGYTISYQDRKYPLVLISPTQSGDYPIDIERLRFQIEGVAQIVQIPVGADTFSFERILGKQYAVWNGAINLVFPEIEFEGKRFAPTRRIFPNDIQEIITGGSDPIREILSIITHKTNLPNSWKHISPDFVLELNRKRELLRLREKSKETGESKEYIEFLEDYTKQQESEASDLRNQAEQLRQEVASIEGRLTQFESQNRQQQLKIDGLQLSLSYSPQNANAEMSTDAISQVLLETVSKSLTPKEWLDVVMQLYPDRITVLDSAFKSAKKSDGFRYKKAGFALLWTLITEYWAASVEGQSDVEARQIFGESYSAKESETAENNARARELRTFVYKGQPMLMLKHLKHGVKPSTAETLRIHFEWDAEEKKIVIGHCGPHLDLK